MSTLGVVVLSLKGMKHLSECVGSVNWADAVLVLHAGNDEPPLGSGSCSSLVVRKAASVKELKGLAREIKADWILHLWGEERIGESLKEQLNTLRRGGFSNSPAAYRIPIRSQLLGRWVEGSLWDPSPALRLCRPATPFAFELWDIPTKENGATPGLMGGWIDDYTLADLGDGMEQIQAVSGLWSDYMQSEVRNFSPAAMTKRSLQVFVRLLLKNRGLTKGLAGLTLSLLAAYLMLLEGAKCWEAKYISGKKVTEG